jgi:uncharacterized iron-regulated membrane protein
MKRVIAFIHKQLALFLGIFLIVQALSGVLISFRHELTDLVFETYNCKEESCHIVSFASLYDKFILDHTFVDLYDVVFPSYPGAPYQFSYDSGSDSLPSIAFLDPYSGETISSGNLLQYPFEVAIYIHSNLLLGSVGKNLVVMTGLFFILMSISGLYLWWPGKLSLFKKSVDINWKGPALKRNFQVHKTFGFYFFCLFLFLGITGTMIAGKKFYLPALSFEYQQIVETDIKKKINLESILSESRKEYPSGEIRVIKFLGIDDDLIRVDIIDKADYFAGKKNQLIFQANNGALLKNLSDENISTSRSIYQWLIPLHSGKIIGLTGRFLNLITGIALLTVMTYGYLLWFRRRRRQKK